MDFRHIPFCLIFFYLRGDVLSVLRAVLGAQLYLRGRAIGFVVSFEVPSPLALLPALLRPYTAHTQEV